MLKLTAIQKLHIIFMWDCLKSNWSVALISGGTDIASCCRSSFENPLIPNVYNHTDLKCPLVWGKSLLIICETHFRSALTEYFSSPPVSSTFSYFGCSPFSMGPGEPSGDPAGMGVMSGAPGRICLRGDLMAAGSCPERAQSFSEPCVFSSLKFSRQ